MQKIDRQDETDTSDLYVTPLAERAKPEVRARLSGPAMRTFLNIGRAWNLSLEEERGLLGWPARSTMYNYHNGKVPVLAYDALQRISLVIGIYKALHILYPDFADRWVNLPNSNPLFGGKSPLEFMNNTGIGGLEKVRRLLDSRRGGWN
ncbi:MAG: DUF2384 domain-containing protein [Verrucomicrobia bacterium]|nr:DUF2384 domain-containing protein [Verrucomicrobiota bacterium]